jgi:hypothetical protein
MLQAVHQKAGGPRASSIYCKWIRDHRRDGAPVVAVWIDSEMRTFEREFSSEPELLGQSALEDPGGTRTFESQRQTTTIEITTYRS